jgi:hypothetical protein
MVEGVTDRTQNPRPPLLTTALSRLLASRVPTPRVIALGEPTHGDETFLTVRNDIVSWIADDFGLAAIALETSADASRYLDEYVCGDADDLDRALEAGFSHGFGRFSGNRDLLLRLRSINRALEAHDRIRCVGIDADMDSRPRTLPPQSGLRSASSNAPHGWPTTSIVLWDRSVIVVQCCCTRTTPTSIGPTRRCNSVRTESSGTPSVTSSLRDMERTIWSWRPRAAPRRHEASLPPRTEPSNIFSTASKAAPNRCSSTTGNSVIS